MKIDMFPHIFPQQFYEKMLKASSSDMYMQKRIRAIPALADLETRFRIMDLFPGYVQVLTLASPPIECITGPQASPDLARLANDGMAELTAKYPDRFLGFAASLPMNNVEAAVKEMDRAITKLGANGVQVFSNVNGRPLDDPEFLPIFRGMAAHDLPIWIHPARGAEFADYPGESKSKYEIWWTLGWPYETSVAMIRIALAGYFDLFPNLKVITHHMGGMIPYFAGRVGPGMDILGARSPEEDYSSVLKRLKRRPIEYLQMFYADTALFGATPATECGLAFFGAEQVIFATDMPFSPDKGPGYIRETIRVMEELPISPQDKEKIYNGNTRRLLKLKVK